MGLPRSEGAARVFDMSATPKVSVVMPVLDPIREHFRSAIRSVLDQSLGDLELIIIEAPGQTPASATIDELSDPRIRHMHEAQMSSIAAQRNRGVELARSDYVAMLDADDACEPDRLERQYEYLSRHPHLSILGSQISIMDAHGVRIGERHYPLSHDEIVAKMRFYNPIAQPSVMFRRKVIQEGGGYSLREDCTCEDYDLWMRLARRGVRFSNMPEFLTRYRVHSESMKCRHLRESLRDTIHIKRTHWKDRLDLPARLRLRAERLALLLPPRLVLALFKRLYFRHG